MVDRDSDWRAAAGAAEAAALELPIAAAALARLRSDAAARWPHEACGLLLGTRSGRRRRVCQAVPLPNVHADPRRGFAIEPLDAARVERAAAEGAIADEMAGGSRQARRVGATRRRGGGLAVLGVYHSHPDGGALPSETDRAAAAAVWPADRCSWSYVIAAVWRGRLCGVRSFVLRGGRFNAERVVVETTARAAAVQP